IILFNQNQVRRIYDESAELWYFSVIDVVQVLTDSSIPRRYWSDLKIKLRSEGSEVYEKIVQLKMAAPDGKQRDTDVADTQNHSSPYSIYSKPQSRAFQALVGPSRLRTH